MWRRRWSGVRCFLLAFWLQCTWLLALYALNSGPALHELSDEQERLLAKRDFDRAFGRLLHQNNPDNEDAEDTDTGLLFNADGLVYNAASRDKVPVMEAPIYSNDFRHLAAKPDYEAKDIQPRGWMGSLLDQTDHSQVPDLGTCHGLDPPAPDLQETYDWQAVGHGNRDTYVFSAYYEPRLVPRAVRVIGIASGRDPIRKYCQVWYPGHTTPEIARAEYDLIPETHEKKYAGAMFVCYLRETYLIPSAVSVVFNKCDQATNLLLVQSHIPSITSSPHNFTVCISPLNFNYSNREQMVETLELNLMFGADRIVIYNYSSSPVIDPIIRTYVREGLLDIIPWRVPVQVDAWPPDPRAQVPEIHYFAQLAMLNECLYRYMYRTRYIVFTDLDEIIVPRSPGSRTWSDMLTNLPKSPKFGAYVVRNVFFHLDWDSDVISSRDLKRHHVRPVSLVKTRRERDPHPYCSRSKLVVDPAVTVMVGVHCVYQFVDNALTVPYDVPADQALVHHYRQSMTSQPVPSTIDRKMYDFWSEVVTRVARRRHLFTTDRKRRGNISSHVIVRE